MASSPFLFHEREKVSNFLVGGAKNLTLRFTVEADFERTESNPFNSKFSKIKSVNQTLDTCEGVLEEETVLRE